MSLLSLSRIVYANGRVTNLAITKWNTNRVSTTVRGRYLDHGLVRIGNAQNTTKGE